MTAHDDPKFRGSADARWKARDQVETIRQQARTSARQQREASDTAATKRAGKSSK